MRTFDVSGSKMCKSTKSAPPNAAAKSGFFKTLLVLEAGATFDDTTPPFARAAKARQCCKRFAKK